MIEKITLERLRRRARLNLRDEKPDYLLIKLDSTRQLSPSLNAISFDGLMVLLVVSGTIQVNSNQTLYNLGPNMLLTGGAGDMLDLHPTASANLSAYILMVKSSFMHDLNVDLNVIKSLPRGELLRPILSIDPTDTAHIRHLFELLDINSRQPIPTGCQLLARSVSLSLLTSTLYQLMLTVMRCSPEAPTQTPDEEPRGGKSATYYTREFMRLVHQHFRREHSPGFYASKLCLSSKYLSMLIKQTTGKTASEHINHLLIIEAKNQLRFSGKNIQQVALELNFTSQSAFGKFFRRLTGLSPSEFLHP